MVITDPEAMENLIYTGDAQKLVSAGLATAGTMAYALSGSRSHTPSGESFTTSIPTATDAGTYYVWYKVKGDANHNDATAQSISVIISKAQNGTGEVKKKFFTFKVTSVYGGEGDMLQRPKGELLRPDIIEGRGVIWNT